MAETGKRRRVVVTGVGAITAQGVGLDAFWDGVRGRRRRDPRGRAPADGRLPDAARRRGAGGRHARSASTCHPDGYREPRHRLRPEGRRGGVSQLRRRPIGPIPPERWGVVIGTCNAGLLAGEEWYAATQARGGSRPRLAAARPPAGPGRGARAARSSSRGPVLSVNTACAASANAIGYAAELIRQGTPTPCSPAAPRRSPTSSTPGFNALESLSPEPAAPYSRDREGCRSARAAGCWC